MKRFLTTASLIAVAGLAAGSADAATIGVTNTQLGTNIDAGSSVTISSWDLTGGNAVAVLLTSEGFTGVSAKYGTQDMIVVETSEGAQRSAIAYLINPTATSADIVVSFTDGGGSSNLVYSAISLSNVASVAGTDVDSSNDDSSLSVSYTTALDGGYVLASAINNANGTNFGTAIPSVTGNPDANLFAAFQNANNGNLHTHGDVATAGAYTDTYSDSKSRTAVSTVAFNAVPEPGSLALLGLGGLLIARRRRA